LQFISGPAILITEIHHAVNCFALPTPTVSIIIVKTTGFTKADSGFLATPPNVSPEADGRQGVLVLH
jgi:hypothetical protein